MITTFFLLLTILLTCGQYSRKEEIKGSISFNNIIRINADKAGYITSIPVATGQHVVKNQLLFTVNARVTDGQSLQQNIPTSSTAIERIKRQLTINEADLTQEIEKENEQKELLTQQINHLLNKADGNMLAEKSIQRRVELLARQKEAYRKLQKTGAATELEIDEAINRHEMAKQEYNANKSEQQLTQQNIVQLRQQINDLSHNLNRRKNELEITKQELAERLEMEMQEQEFSVLAPEDAVVDAVASYEGDSIESERPVMILKSNRVSKGQEAIRIHLSVSPETIGFIKPDLKIWLRVDAFPYQEHGVLEAKVKSVTSSTLASAKSHLLDNETRKSKNYLVEAELVSSYRNPKLSPVWLKDGMTVNASIKLEKLSLLEWLFLPVQKSLKRNPDFLAP